MLVTDHDDTAELYRPGLENASFAVQRCETIDEAIAACHACKPLAIVVHFTPRHDASTVGAALRSGNPGAVLIGLFSIQLSLGSLKTVLEDFDDVILIPCAPEALVARVVGLHEKKERMASA
jgi:DNA-binding response OmpR family regulator